MYFTLHHFLNFQKKKEKRDPNRMSKLSMHHHATVDQMNAN